MMNQQLNSSTRPVRPLDYARLSVIVRRGNHTFVDAPIYTGERRTLLLPAGRLARYAPGTPVMVKHVDGRGRAFGVAVGGGDGPLVTVTLSTESHKAMSITLGSSHEPNALTCDWPAGFIFPIGIIVAERLIVRDLPTPDYAYFILDPGELGTDQVVATILAGVARRELTATLIPPGLSGREKQWEDHMAPHTWRTIIEPLMSLRERALVKGADADPHPKIFGESQYWLDGIVKRAIVRIPFEYYFLERAAYLVTAANEREPLNWGSRKQPATTIPGFISWFAESLPKIIRDEEATWA